MARTPGFSAAHAKPSRRHLDVAKNKLLFRVVWGHGYAVVLFLGWRFGEQVH
jgi:hypothetical protein